LLEIMILNYSKYVGVPFGAKPRWRRWAVRHRSLVTPERALASTMNDYYWKVALSSIAYSGVAKVPCALGQETF